MENLLQPLGLIWAGALILGIRCVGRRKFGGAAWAFATAAFIHAIGGTPLGAWLLADLERPYVLPTRSVVPADAVVMLGGTHSSTRFGWLPFNLADSGDRVLVALEMVRLGKAPALVLGGSYYEAGNQRRPDSELLLAWIQAWHLPAGRVHLLGTCSDTHDEAERTARLARTNGWHRILVVSTAAHLRRADATFRKTGLDVQPVGCDFIGLDRMSSKGQWLWVPRLDGFLLVNTWMHEEIGWIYYQLKGWA